MVQTFSQVYVVCVYLGPAAPSESWLPASLSVSADLAVGDVGGGAALGTV